MSSGASKSQTVTQNTVSDPWSGQQPYLGTGFARAAELLNQGGPQYFQGETTTPFSPQTEQALRLTEGRALAGSPLVDSAQGLTQQTLGGQYLNANPYSGRLYDTASQAWAPEAQSQLSANMGGEYLNSNPFGGMMYNNAAQGYQQQAAQVTPLMNNTLSGGYLNSNPWLDQSYDRAASAVTRNFRDALMPSLDASFGSAGRYGSGLHAASRGAAYDELGRSLEGLAGSMYGQNYESERGRQMQALGLQNANAQQERASMMQGLGMGAQSFDAERARQLQSLGMYGDQFGQSRSAQMQALGMGAQGYEAERARQQQALGVAPALADYDYADIGRLAGVGSAIEQQAGNYLGGDVARWDYGQNLPWNTLGNYMGLIQGGYGGSSSSTSTQPTYGGNKLQSALGGASMGASLGTLLGGLGGGAAGGAATGAAAGSIVPGWGTAIGAGLGALGGLLF